MTKAEFQAFVLGILESEFPGRGFRAGRAEDLIVCGQESFGLQNLQAVCAKVGKDVEELRRIVANHFSRLDDIDCLRDDDSPAWSIIMPRLRPQFMPAEFIAQAPIVHLPVGPGETAGILIGIVLDSDAGYSYVRQEDGALWGRTADELLDAAVENLKEASRELPMAMFPEPNLAIVIETKDGYDAARLLVPDIRQFVASKLGEPFFAGIPNRDFLIMWSQEASEEFRTMCREKIGEDFRAQDHPLTPRILVATAEEVSVEED